jgi:Flp pilus assembly protein TadG
MRQKIFSHILDRLKNKKGVSLIIVALLIILLFAFAALAIDIAYMYFVKNELQVAADAAALAGAALITNPNDLTQSNARAEAILFAGKNKAAGSSVILDSNNTNVLSDSNDITVGNWNGTTYTAGATPVNAIQVRARRTENSPGGPVSIFLGRIIGLIPGAQAWNVMSASAEAIASLTPPRIIAVPICLPNCGLKTPISAQWGFDKNPQFGNDPIESTHTEATPPGQLFFLGKSETTGGVRRPGMAWTNFYINICNVNPQCNMPNPQEIKPYITGTQNAPLNLCNNHICTTNGTMANVLDTLKDEFNKNKKTYQFTVGSNNISIVGWEVYVPVVSDDTCGTSSVCPGAQAESANPYLVKGFARILITDVNTSGDQGIRVVGFNNPRTYTFSYKVNQPGRGGPVTINVTTNITDISCLDCPATGNEPPAGISTAVKLVR